jgi:hypothetical protein
MDYSCSYVAPVDALLPRRCCVHRASENGPAVKQSRFCSKAKDHFSGGGGISHEMFRGVIHKAVATEVARRM